MNFLAFGVLLAHFIWCALSLNGIFLIYLTIIAGYTVANFLKTRKYPNSFRRKMQIATWLDGGNPRVMGQMNFDIDAVESKLREANLPKGEYPPRAVIFAKGFAHSLFALKKNLGKLTLGNFVPLPGADVSFQIQIRRGEVGFILIRDVHSKSLKELGQEYRQKEAALKNGEDATHNFIKKLAGALPTFLFQAVFRVLMWVVHDLGIGLDSIGLPREPFGTITVTDINDTGLVDSFGVLNPLTKAFIQVQLCKAEPRVVAENNEVVVRNIMNIDVVFDHRYADGADGAKMLRMFKDYVDNLEQSLGK